MSAEKQLQALVDAGAILSRGEGRWTLVFAAITDAGLYWIALPALDQSSAHKTPFDRVDQHGEALRFWLKGELAAYVTTAADTPEVNTDAVLDELALWRAAMQDPDRRASFEASVAADLRA